MKFLCEKWIPVDEAEYVSNGSATQYKNHEQFVNIAHHEGDFGCKAKWNFHATCHGKRPCDGIGGIIEKSASKANLQRQYAKQITTACEMYNWATMHLKDIYVEFCSSGVYKVAEVIINERFENWIIIDETQ